MHNYVPENSAQKTTVSVVGARGYTGLELAELLLEHPRVKFTKAFATKDFKLTDDLLNSKAAAVECRAENEILENLTDVVFLATPAEVSLKLAPEILKRGKKVIDLSGAFRLKTQDYLTWYKFSHTAPSELKAAHYGLLPFAGPPRSALVANPGCYATAILMALIPLLKKDLLEIDTLVIDAKSGTSGAGRKAAENLLLSEVDGECLPYRVGQHQHTPEIQEAALQFSGAALQPHFATHLLGTKRGLIASLYARAKTSQLEDLLQAYQEAYQNYPLVRFGADISRLASLNRVVRTPYTHISFQLVGDKLYLFSCLDNLQKGAASQAVENLNALMDWPLTMGLLKSPEEFP